VGFWFLPLWFLGLDKEKVVGVEKDGKKQRGLYLIPSTLLHFKVLRTPMCHTLGYQVLNPNFYINMTLLFHCLTNIALLFQEVFHWEDQ
jgi:hypothetical protein